MATFEIGRVCMKNSGRDLGKKCVVVNLIDDKFVEVICAGRKKRRRCNKSQLAPLDELMGAGSDEEVLKALA
ncbi:MAG: 50S ribosomal protein L14e [Candidatus Micrarchaeota archaeon]